MEQNFRLLMAIRERGLTQRSFARAVGDHASFVSRVIRGWMNVDQARKDRYAAVLGKDVSDIFGK